MRYDKDKGGYYLTPNEVADLNRKMADIKRQYEAMKEIDRLVPWWTPGKSLKS